MINLFLHAALLTTTPILLAAIGGFVNRMGGSSIWASNR
jgi:hypothetical protein